METKIQANKQCNRF